MKITCPTCETEDVYLCSTAYEQGTTHTKTTSTGTATTSGYSPGTGIGTAQTNINTTNNSTSQTAFAKKAAPPENYLSKMIGWMVISFIIMILMPSSAGFFKGLFMLSFLGGIVGTVLAYKKLPAYREALALWQKSWICGRCGNKFVPEKKQEAQPAPVAA